MSLLSTVEPLKCTICPFLDCSVQHTCYECQCFIDKTLKLDKYCDNEDMIKQFHPDCPLIDGKKFIIKVEDGQLIIRREY